MSTVNIIQIVSTLVYGLSCWIIIRNGGGIVGVAAANLATMLIEYGTYWVLASKFTHALEVTVKQFDKGVMRDTAKLALSQLLVAASGLILLRTDPIIIQGFLSLAAVSTYAVALRISESAFLLVKQFVNVLSPHIAEMYGRGDKAGLKRLFLISSRYALVPAVAVSLPLAMFGREILTFWIGPEMAPGGPVLAVLCISMGLMTPQVVASAFMTYTGRYLHTSRPVVGGAVLNVIFSLICVKLFGLVGVAIGTLAAVIVADVFWIGAISLKEMNVGLREYLVQALLPVVPGSLVYAATMFGLATVWPPHALIGIAWVGALGLLCFALVFALTGLRESDRRRFRRARA